MTVQQVASYYPERINLHVPDMQYHSDVGIDGLYAVEIAAPVTADTDGILDAESINAAGSTTTFMAAYVEDDDPTVHVMGEYGRNVTLVASGTATSTVTVHGRDYLNQPMTETITLTSGTPVAGIKCFKYIDEVAWSGTSSITIDMGWGTVLGLPFKTLALISELVSGAAPTAGAIVAGVATDPATATTGDPRGRYAPHASFVPNGSRTYELILRADKNDLHGVEHFYSG